MKKLIGALAIFMAIAGTAQQEAMFTHYSFNTLAINPGYAGTRNALTLTALHRSQWVGFEGAPQTQTFTIHSPVFRKELGVGLSFVNDKIGPINNTSAFIDLAYHLKINTKSTLSFGLKGGLNLMQASFSDLTLENSSDQAFSGNIQNQINPNFGFGMYYHSSRWYAGISTPRLLENGLDNLSTGANTEKRHYYLIGGAVFNLTPILKFKPTMFLKVTEAAPAEADLTAMFLIDRLEVGAMFRTGDAVGVLAGFNINDQLRFGYSFDWSYTNTTFTYNYGSHELMLRYDFIYPEDKKIKSPRYF